MEELKLQLLELLSSPDFEVRKLAHGLLYPVLSVSKIYWYKDPYKGWIENPMGYTLSDLLERETYKLENHDIEILDKCLEYYNYMTNG